MPHSIVLSLIIIFLLLIALFLFIILVVVDSFRTKAPFISTKDIVIPEIINSLALKDNSILFDLGCGNGCILRSIGEKNKSIKLIGVDRGFLPIIVSRILSFHTSIKYMRGNMLDVDVSMATHIYLYTGTELMILLENKLFKECSPGTRIVSLDFLFPSKKPIEQIVLPKSNTYSSQNVINIYVV